MKKRAQKGMVLILTSLILFVVTTVLALLTSLIIANRNQKTEYIKVEEEKIVLRNGAYEVYSKILPQVGSLTFYSTVDNEDYITKNGYQHVTITADESCKYFTGSVDVYRKYNKVGGNDIFGEKYFTFTLNKDNLPEVNKSSARGYSIVVKLQAENFGVPSITNFKIKEMRFE